MHKKPLKPKQKNSEHHGISTVLLFIHQNKEQNIFRKAEKPSLLCRKCVQQTHEGQVRKVEKGHRGQEKIQQRVDFLLSPIPLSWGASVKQFGGGDSEAEVPAQQAASFPCRL